MHTFRVSMAARGRYWARCRGVRRDVATKGLQHAQPAGPSSQAPGVFLFLGPCPSGTLLTQFLGPFP
eukprot:9482174-Pyramimonas_sp.AAC.1